MNRDTVEFYYDNKLLCSVKSSMVPRKGDLINIRKKTYEIIRVTYALDNTDNPNERGMRVNIDLASY